VREIPVLTGDPSSVIAHQIASELESQAMPPIRLE
jgi:hypothetical protein